MQYSVPILFVIFKREDVALKSFERIRQVRPSKLYIAGDGPREGIAGENKMVEDTRRAIIDAIDWPCEVKTLFRQENLGCGMGVYSAIEWLFNNEECGIILEDDCIADSSFFQYVAELLERFKDDSRIGMIAGFNQVTSYTPANSYCFSKYAACWGWATWRRAWANMDLKMDFRNNKLKDVLLNRGYLGRDCSRWRYQIKEIDAKHVSAWDWQWFFSLASQNQLCIFPQVNLVSNIGNDEEATHTAFSEISIKSQALNWPLNHPNYIVPDMKFDKAFFRTGNTARRRLLRCLPHGLKQRIKKVISSIK